MRARDLDGHEIICYVMGHGALLLGHSHPAVVAAVRDQATLAFHPGAWHELECEWAEAVIGLVPSAELVRFTSSGTEASLLALPLARAATGRHGWSSWPGTSTAGTTRCRSAPTRRSTAGHGRGAGVLGGW